MRAAVLALLALAGCTQTQDSPLPKETGAGSSGAKADFDVDGQWQITTLNGAPAPRAGAYLTVAGGNIEGGYDACNHWGFTEFEGRRVVASDAMACPGLPAGEAYAELTLTDPSRIEIWRAPTELIIFTPGHRFTASPMVSAPAAP